MKFVLLCFIIFLSSLASVDFAAAAPLSDESRSVLSFKDWKSRKVAESRSVLEQMLHEDRKSRGHSMRLQKRIHQARLNLQFARELSAHDYFIVYLSPQYPGNRKALESAVRRMNVSEVVEILNQYQNSLRRPEEDKQRENLPHSIYGAGIIDHIGGRSHRAHD